MKQLIIIVICMLSVFKGFSQERKLQLAFLATPQISWITSDNADASSAGSRLGYSIGLQGDYFFAKNYAISTSILYSKLGGKLEYSAPFNAEIGGISTTVNAGDEVLYKLTYIEVPIGLKLKTKEFRRNIFWGQVGLSPMVNIDAVNKQNNDLSKEVSLFNLGYHFGIGTDFSLGGSTYLTGALMLTNGFTDITSSKFKDKAVLNAVNLRLGIIF